MNPIHFLQRNKHKLTCIALALVAFQAAWCTSIFYQLALRGEAYYFEPNVYIAWFELGANLFLVLWFLVFWLRRCEEN